MLRRINWSYYVELFCCGHHIDRNHWYRDPSEGTRICGNVGHWLDLAVHMLSWERMPIRWQYPSRSVPVLIVMTILPYLNQRDWRLIVIVLTSRAEPFEGINETIVFQKKNVMAKIDDFEQ